MLIGIRVLGAVFGLVTLLWVFRAYRNQALRRANFLLFSLLGIAILCVSIEPDVSNWVTGTLSGKQFGRIIVLLILSNLALWVLVIGLRSKNDDKSYQFDLLVRRLAAKEFLEEPPEDAICHVTAVMPALNEAENLEHLLPKFPREVCGQKLGALVVDDGSTDGTSEVVQKHGFAVARNPLRRGGGAALRLGYDVAAAMGAKVVVTMDADGQHRPEEIERLVQPILDGKADIVIGSRVLGEREKDSAVRWAGIHLFNSVINLLAGTRITDCSNGFRAFSVEALQSIRLRQDQFHTAELIIDAARQKLRITEAPITVLRRHSGESKKGKNLSYGVNFGKTVLKTWLRE